MAFIYFLKTDGLLGKSIQGTPRFERVKIGFTANIGTRLRTHQVSCPVPLTYWGAIKAQRDDETFLHKHLREFRIHREWFQVTEPVETVIEKLLDGRQSITDIRPKGYKTIPHRECARSIDDLGLEAAQ